jgi:hypothetical protein
MKNNNLLNNITIHLKSIASTTDSDGLRNGRTGLSFFFFYNARFTGNDEEETYAYSLLEQVLSSPLLERDMTYSNGLAGIGCYLDFLVKEAFLDVEGDNVFEDFDSLLANAVNNYTYWDYSFSTGLAGLCSYILQRKACIEVIPKALDLLLNSFQDNSRRKVKIEPLFLFPSEVLEDVRLLNAEVKDSNLFPLQTEVLEHVIEAFTKRYPVLQSNCPDYYVIQRLRKARIENNDQEIGLFLQKSAEASPNKIIQGLSIMSLENPTLPAWWRLL